MTKPISVILQCLLPQHLISRCAAAFMNTRIPWLKNKIIKWFVKRYQVDLSMAKKEHITDYATFNDFFTRELKPHLRPIFPENDALIAPVDGYISAIGTVKKEKLIQAKAVDYSLAALLANDKQLIETFAHSSYATFYLSPKDYHCVHMPIDGALKRTLYVPGRLFSVNLKTAQYVPNLFARNERLICEFETACGPMLVIFVGAIIVAGIHTVWGGQEAPCGHGSIHEQLFSEKPHYTKGAKIGHFNVGSTIIVMFKHDGLNWSAQESNNICYGQQLATIKIG